MQSRQEPYWCRKPYPAGPLRAAPGSPQSTHEQDQQYPQSRIGLQVAHPHRKLRAREGMSTTRKCQSSTGFPAAHSDSPQKQTPASVKMLPVSPHNTYLCTIVARSVRGVGAIPTEALAERASFLRLQIDRHQRERDETLLSRRNYRRHRPENRRKSQRCRLQSRRPTPGRHRRIQRRGLQLPIRKQGNEAGLPAHRQRQTGARRDSRISSGSPIRN